LAIPAHHEKFGKSVRRLLTESSSRQAKKGMPGPEEKEQGVGRHGFAV